MNPFVEQLGRVLDRREVDRARVATSLVVGRNTDGTIRQQRLDRPGCVERGCVTADGVGAIVQAAPRCQQSAGSTGVSSVSAFGGGAFVWVEGIEPSVFEPDQSYTVTVTGLGFLEGTRVEFLIDAEEVHPEITIEARRLIDSETIELDIVVSPDAEPIVDAPLAFGHSAGVA